MTSWKTTFGALNDYLWLRPMISLQSLRILAAMTSRYSTAGSVTVLNKDRQHIIGRLICTALQTLKYVREVGSITMGCVRCVQIISKANDTCRAPMVFLRRYAKRPGWECYRTIPEMKETGRLNPFSTFSKKSPMIKNVFDSSPIPYDNVYYLNDTD